MTRSHVERRLHARFPHRFDIEGPPDEVGALAHMVASDLSLGGLHCSSSRDYPEMTRVAVRFRLPGDSTPDPIDVEAVVVRRRKVESPSPNGGYELALFFTSMSDASRERVARFLARHASN